MSCQFDCFLFFGWWEGFLDGPETNDGLPASARPCSDWTAADSAPSRTDWLARSSTANGWAACAADTGVYENTWTDNTEKQQTSPLLQATIFMFIWLQCINAQ